MRQDNQLVVAPEKYLDGAQRLDKTAKAQLLPFSFRLWAAWLIVAIIAGAMSYISEGVFEYRGLPQEGAWPLAIFLQLAAVAAFHWWVDGQLHRWSGGTFHHKEKPFNGALLAVVIASLLLMWLAYTRAQMYIEDAGTTWSPLAAVVASFVFSLVEPFGSWILGVLTSAAGRSIAFPKDIRKRAHEHRQAIEGGPLEEKWQQTMNQATDEKNEAEDEVESISNPPVIITVDKKEVKLRKEHLAHLETWRRMLARFKPVTPDTSLHVQESTKIYELPKPHQGIG